MKATIDDIIPVVLGVETAEDGSQCLTITFPEIPDAPIAYYYLEPDNQTAKFVTEDYNQSKTLIEYFELSESANIDHLTEHYTLPVRYETTLRADTPADWFSIQSYLSGLNARQM